MNRIQHEQLLTKYKECLVKEKWNILDEPWQIVTKTKGHRTISKDINGINEIKQMVLDKLGYIGPFIFLNEYFSQMDWVGPYRNVEKCLLLIYHLLSG
jgi:hypothetical protein